MASNIHRSAWFACTWSSRWAVSEPSPGAPDVSRFICRRHDRGSCGLVLNVAIDDRGEQQESRFGNGNWGEVADLL
jgi:hypothetical protein